MPPLYSYLGVEALLLVLLRFAPFNGIWLLLCGFLAIGFVGALVFRERPLENSRALIVSSGIIFAVLWLYILVALATHVLADPAIMPAALRQALQQNAAGNILGAIPNMAGEIFTSWVICVMLAIVGNSFGGKVRRLAGL
ncbi:MAG: hypothetical protein ACYDAG_11435 [Chloroflexota bacterium]